MSRFLYLSPVLLSFQEASLYTANVLMKIRLGLLLDHTTIISERIRGAVGWKVYGLYPIALDAVKGFMGFIKTKYRFYKERCGSTANHSREGGPDSGGAESLRPLDP